MARHLADVLDPSNTRSRVLADRGYDSGANRNVLEEHHLEGGIARRTQAGKEPGGGQTQGPQPRHQSHSGAG
ncbi:hypothetical protein [Ralstonia solanacearum]|uniref:hypothetical protein n=1 Tax=Ralstonia solanacearum TaxID=305 RepID=UPI002029F9F1|nr:hypothetical protein [Ralstonia solanacearum]MCL9843476.1 hypothetical protein [Ralstonia solanacearum]MDC6304955.1 hypothetical protein [Ralstonia solanacearum]